MKLLGTAGGGLDDSHRRHQRDGIRGVCGWACVLHSGEVSLFPIDEAPVMLHGFPERDATDFHPDLVSLLKHKAARSYKSSMEMRSAVN